MGLPCRVIAAWNDSGLVRWVSSLVVAAWYGILLMGFGRFCTPAVVVRNAGGCVLGMPYRVVVVRNVCRRVLGMPYRVGVVRNAGNGFGTFRTVPRAVGFWVGVGIPGFLFPDMRCGTVRKLFEGLLRVPYHAVVVREMPGPSEGFCTTRLWRWQEGWGWSGSCG